MKKLQITLGVVFWIGAIVAVGAGLRPATETRDPRQVPLMQFFSGPSERFRTQDPTGRLRKNDPIFFQGEEGVWRQIGYVSKNPDPESDQSVDIDWYDDRVESKDCQLTHYQITGRLDEVVETMLPPEKREMIQQRVADVMAAHGEELTEAFRPLVQQSIQQSLPVIEIEFQRATRRHRGEIDKLAEKWNEEIVSQRLIPIARREILPIVRRHGEPVAEEIGRELWDRASLWRFGWRAVYDKAPLPQRNLVQGEWDRFVQSEAIPVFESHMDDIVESVQRVVLDVARNRRVRSEIADVADELTADPETRRVVRSILKETLVDNQRLRQVWTDVWNGSDAKRAMNLASDRLEPVIRSIGDDMFGTPETGINPDFARVLRNQILGKDRRWIVATRSENPDRSQIALSRKTMAYPIVYTADGIDVAKADRP